MLVGEFQVESLPRVQLVAKMMGKEFDDISAIKNKHKLTENVKEAQPLISAKGLGKAGKIKPFDLDIYKGEVIGLTGLLGSGRTELARTIYCADKPDSGELYVNGKLAKYKAPLDAMKDGMGFLPEDRKQEGVIADLSVRENLILAMQAKKGALNLIGRKEQEKLADEYIKLLQIKTANMETPIKQLSGGNQQKVILARWLMTNPDFLILDEPTRGIDVGTKTEIQKLVLRLSDEGKTVIFISSEIEEMLRTVGRMGVMRDQAKVGELDEGDLSQNVIMRAIAGGESNDQ
jgi:simple sugar transport system ATP-binding protein